MLPILLLLLLVNDHREVPVALQCSEVVGGGESGVGEEGASFLGLQTARLIPTQHGLVHADDKGHAEDT